MSFGLTPGRDVSQCCCQVQVEVTDKNLGVRVGQWFSSESRSCLSIATLLPQLPRLLHQVLYRYGRVACLRCREMEDWRRDVDADLCRRCIRSTWLTLSLVERNKDSSYISLSREERFQVLQEKMARLEASARPEPKAPQAQLEPDPAPVSTPAVQKPLPVLSQSWFKSNPRVTPLKPSRSRDFSRRSPLPFARIPALAAFYSPTPKSTPPM